MKKLMSLAFAVIAAVIGYVVVQNGGLKNLPINLGSAPPATNPAGPPPPRATDTIRVATWNIQVFGESKLADAAVMNVIVKVLRNFDVVAIQEVRAQSQDILPQLVAMLNADGRSHYDYVIGPRLGRTNSKEQYAFVFDLASIEVDRNQLYTINDPDDLLHREPLVGWFRARSTSPQQAFTFSLVNVHTDPDEVDRELDVLDDVFFAVRDDQRREDDVILLGDFNVNDKHLGQLGQISGLARVVSNNTPTNTKQNAQYDNIFFHSVATPEYTGRGGVYDFLREFNLTVDQALKVSDHFPVWAEFSVFEGGLPGPLAARP
ncbi:MAG: endonuclease/exonuclease/phosphatase family protein [Pirellulaceae bacterium]|nr:endonuclease/exonuclease/phosphatase family protein [Pirellulaceae bacterium]